MNILKIFTLILLLALSACVGTVQDANKQNTQTEQVDSESELEFPGIVSANAIANDKVEITFLPCTTVSAESTVYVIRYSGQTNPIYVHSSAFTPDYRGRFKYTATGLTIESTYVFSVQVLNIKTGVESSNSATVAVKTFANKTANFMGISEVRNLQGAEGTRGIKVLWNPAEIKGSITTPDEIDPLEYKITVIDSEYMNPGNMNDPSFPEPQRRVVGAGSDRRTIEISGLQPNRKYYVQARCSHYGYKLYGADTSYLLEQNTKYLEITTYSEELSNLVFDDSSFALSLPPGNGGLYSIQTKWNPPTGNFDHYRIYYSTGDGSDLTNYLNTHDGDAVCAGTETAPYDYINCRKVEVGNVGQLLTGLKTNQNYSVIVAVCVSKNCEAGKRVISAPKEKATVPPVASFQGISSISAAESLSTLDKVTLNFELPNLLSGGLSGYAVFYYGSDPTNVDARIDLNDPLVLNTTGLSVEPFTLLESTKIMVSGINPTSTDPYCFMIVPFTYNVDGTKNYGDTAGYAPRCITPTIEGPNDTVFPGFTIDGGSECLMSSGTISLKWEAPEKGIYTHYEIFYERGSDVFDFSQALNWQQSGSIYKRILLDSSFTNYRLTGLDPSSLYKVGILTYYNSMNGPIRSKYNSGFFTCTGI